MANEHDMKMYVWKRLSFPLWKEPRPSFEFFEMVNTILTKKIPFVVVSNYESLKKTGDRKSWLEWTFDHQHISEETRLSIQAALEDFFGENSGRDFRWDGTAARTIVREVIALGPHIQ